MIQRPSKGLVCVVLLLTAACTTMRPAAPRSVEQGADVIVHMTEGRDIELASLTVRNVRAIEGTFLRWNDDGEALVVSREVTTGGGVTQATQGETLRVQESNIQTLEARTSDGTRTAILVAIGGGLVAVALIAIGASGSGGDPGGNGPGNGTQGFVQGDWGEIRVPR